MELLTAADAKGWRGDRRRLAGHRRLAAEQKAPTVAGRWLGDPNRHPLYVAAAAPAWTELKA